jgi:hypothetical protein
MEGWFGCKVEEKKEQTETNAVLLSLSLSPPFLFFLCLEREGERERRGGCECRLAITEFLISV